MPVPNEQVILRSPSLINRLNACDESTNEVAKHLWPIKAESVQEAHTDRSILDHTQVDQSVDQPKSSRRPATYNKSKQ